MSIIGSVEKFNFNQNDWHIFKAQLDQFFIANDVTVEVKKKAILISALSEQSYKLVNNLIHPNKIETASYDVLSKAFSDHLKPTVSGFAERHKFYSAVKDHHETVNQWAARVRSLSISCEFGVELNSALRDKFVMGLQKGAAKDKLFLESVEKLTFDKAVEIANAVECVKHQYELDVSIKQEPSSSDGIYRMGQTRQKGNSGQVTGKQHHQQQRRQKQQGNNSYMDTSSIESNEPIKLKVCMNSIPMTMEIDTGASISAISLKTYRDHFKLHALETSSLVFNNYNGTKIKPIGVCVMDVLYKNVCKKIKVVVVENGGPPLLGRNFLNEFGIKFENLYYVEKNISSEVHAITENFSELFDGKLGKFNKSLISLHVKSDCCPKFFKPRQMPLALKEKVESEIDKLVDLGVLEPVNFSEWGTPIVPILKKSGEVRICGDFKITVNPQLLIDKYPLPRIEELFAQLHGGEEFTKLDLSMAYQQLVLDDESRKLTTISTTKGLFRYTRLVYGLASAPAVFQKMMDSLLMGIKGVVVFLDDILITAPNRKLHIEKVKNVLKILQDAGLKLNKDKCTFLAKSINYLGHVIDKSGLKTCPNKIKTIQEIQDPTCLKELQSFLGVINFYRKFLPNVTTLCALLYDLLKKTAKFEWTEVHSEAISKIKRELISKSALAHFNPMLVIKLTVDASPIGLGAVLSQVYENGLERPIEFASRKLTDTEQKYSQLDREAIAILFGVKRFHHYLYGREFTLVTDNKPLMHIFGSKKGIPQMAANRLQRIALVLTGYTFKIECIRSHANVADYFSRFPNEESVGMQVDDSNLCYINYVKEISNLPLTIEDVKKESEKDAIVSKVIQYMQSGWEHDKVDVSDEKRCDSVGNEDKIPSVNSSNEIQIETSDKSASENSFLDSQDYFIVEESSEGIKSERGIRQSTRIRNPPERYGFLSYVASNNDEDPKTVAEGNKERTYV
ncbi:uncharacterized protein LOC129947217 [Eupeodes corollae]|uniref:uncharacterized protein LOC129947217 n=1 Tax=Eupeodes corollae TaxID=290404 RepID=UPI00249133FD|nr:uncharacterized protein LOC129947217 [Eupeodes corollae]